MITSAILYENVVGKALRAQTMSFVVTQSVFEVWQVELRALKELCEEVGNVMGDREILLVHPIFIPHVVSRRQ